MCQAMRDGSAAFGALEKHVVSIRQGVGFDANWTQPVNGVICTTNDSGYHSHVLVVFLWLTPSSFVCAFIVSISYCWTVTAMVMVGLFYRLFVVINPLAILRIFSFHYAHLQFTEIFDQKYNCFHRKKRSYVGGLKWRTYYFEDPIRHSASEAKFDKFSVIVDLHQKPCRTYL